MIRKIDTRVKTHLKPFGTQRLTTPDVRHKPVPMSKLFTYDMLDNPHRRRIYFTLISCGMSHERAIHEAKQYVYRKDGTRFARIVMEG